MNSSGKTLTILLGTLVVVMLLAFLLLSGVAATFAWMAGSGYGSGPPTGQRSISMPGDVMIFKDAGIGHAAIIMSVELPTITALGAITFSNSNSVSPYTTMPLLPDLTVDTESWPGYSVWGYILPSPD